MDIVNLLLQHGADPSIKDDLGKFPHEYCNAFPEMRGALKRAIHLQLENKKVTLHRRVSTASDLMFPMYLISLDQLEKIYGGTEPRQERIEAHQELKRRGEIVRWNDLPFDAHIIFFSHEWVGWNHPDPHGIQLKTFLKVMKRLRSGKISRVDMSAIHQLFYKTNFTKRSEQWKEILNTAYVWIDWASMPQPGACSPSTSKEEKDTMGINLGKAVKSIPAYVSLEYTFSSSPPISLSLSLSLSLSSFSYTHTHTQQLCRKSRLCCNCSSRVPSRQQKTRRDQASNDNMLSNVSKKRMVCPRSLCVVSFER